MKPLIILYILIAYAFASFLWWSYVLLDDNRNELKLEKRLLYEQDGKPNIEELAEYKELIKKYDGRIYMIVGEGVVFLLLLLLGTVKLQQSFKQELALKNQQNNFLLSVNHELKSPLASIKLAIQTLLKRNLEKKKYEKLLNNSLADVDRLEKLVSNVLLATKLENRSYDFVKESLNLSELLKGIVDRVKAAIDQEIETNIMITGDELGITSVINNLLENAVKYSGDKPVINVRLYTDKQSIILEVSDNGIGIPDKEKNKIFNKFYRLGNEETRRTKGTGLGMFIVKEVLDSHHAKILVKDNQQKGTIFQIVFRRL